MRAWVGIVVGLGLAAAGCSRQSEGSSELVRELRAMRGTLERMQGSAQRPAQPTGRPAEVDATAVQQALEPLRELAQTLLAEQEALRARQDALTGEMSRWAQLVAPLLQGGPAADLQALQNRLAVLEEELRAQDTRHREVQDLLLRAMNTTSERLGAFLETMSELRRSDAEPDTEVGRESPVEPRSERPEPPDGRRTEDAGPENRRREDDNLDDRKPVGSRPDPASSYARPGSRSRGAAESWTPWVLLAGGALASLFVWRLWREPATPPPVQPAVEPDTQDWWVVVEELAQAMGVQPGQERPSSEVSPADNPADDPADDPAEDPAEDHADYPEPTRHETVHEAAVERVFHELPQQLELPDAESALAPAVRPDSEPLRVPERPAGDSEAPALLELDEPCADCEHAAEQLRRWLSREPRVLLRPTPRIETGDGRLRLRAWVTWDLPVGERRHLWTAARQLVHSGGPMTGPR